MIARRRFVGLLAGLPLLAAGHSHAQPARDSRIGRLIRESRDYPNVGARIDFISRGLLGIRYQANTLIGSATSPEKFVVRDDAFDCVTYCEVVLAAAIASDLGEFETALRRIRYDNGKVQWDQRNHYFSDWCQRNIENKICDPVSIEPSMKIEKTVTWHRALGPRKVSIHAIAKQTMLGNTKRLVTGDIVGFTSRRAEIDFFHTGLIVFGKTGELLLRHASQSRGRVIDEPMTAFVAENAVKHVTLVRASATIRAAELR